MSPTHSFVPAYGWLAWQRGRAANATRTILLLATVACTQDGSLAPLPSPPPPPPDIPPDELWVDLLADPCLLSAAGDLRCFVHERIVGYNLVSYTSPDEPLTELAYSQFFASGLGADSRIHKVIYTPDAQVSEGNGPTPIQNPDLPDVPLSQYAAWGGIDSTGEVRSQFEVSPVPKREWLALADTYFIGLDTDHVLHFRYRVQSETLQVPTDLRGEPVKLIGFPAPLPLQPWGNYYACVLDTFGEITCVTEGDWFEALFQRAPFDNPPYAHLAQRDGMICAQRATDHAIECSDGSVRPFEPLRKLAVHMGQLRASDEGEPAYRAAYDDYIIPICGITYDNRIRCDSPYYTDEVLDQLEALP